MDEVRIVRAGPERVDELEPLWREMQDHHRALGCDLPGIPMRGHEDAWARRRAEYSEWLRRPGAFALVAEDDGRPVGYALVGMNEPGDDTHQTRERYAELHSLLVLPAYRGSRLGTRMMQAVHVELRSLGVREMVIGVMVGNPEAARFYERFGYRPWVTKYLGVVPEA
jgi:GNAT superfamily N-acetyltransferase